MDDGLKRNQFGGTLGGPIVQRQAVLLRRLPGHARRARRRRRNIAFVPTAAMLAGDFTAFASPACNGGRQIALRRAVRQQPDRSGALQPGGAEARAGGCRRRPIPCGEITYSAADDSDEGQVVGRVDYQLSANHSIFGRYMATFDKKPAPFADVRQHADDGDRRASTTSRSR